MAAAIAAVAVAVPAYLGGQASDVAAPTPPAVVDGVQVGYLPSGLGTPEQEKVRDGGLPGTRATWGSGDDEVLVTVYRPPVLELGDPEVMLARLKESSGALRGGALVRGRPGLTTLADDDLVWVERPDLVLRVTVGTRHRSDLRAVADGLEPEGRTGGAFEGLLLTYLPAPAPGRARLRQRFLDPDAVERERRLDAAAGRARSGRRGLADAARLGRNPSAAVRRHPGEGPGKPGYSATLDDPDQRQAHVRLWVEKQGLGYLLAVSSPWPPNWTGSWTASFPPNRRPYPANRSTESASPTCPRFSANDAREQHAVRQRMERDDRSLVEQSRRR
ncbi:hypothetical protein ACFQX6_48570 [Streptosporangium lutulentum]